MLRNLREAQDKRAVPYGSLTTASQTLTPLIGTINTWTQNPAAYPQTMTDADVLMDTLVGELAKWPTFTEKIVPARIAEAEHYVAAIQEQRDRAVEAYAVQQEHLKTQLEQAGLDASLLHDQERQRVTDEVARVDALDLRVAEYDRRLTQEMQRLDLHALHS